MQDQSSNMVVISAASPNQVNYETKDPDGQGVGSLSIAFTRAMGELDKGSDYRILFEKIKARIQADFPDQIPMVEGNTSQQIFEGKYLEQSELVTISRWLSDSSFSINQGELHGLYKSSTVRILKLSGDQPVAEGWITESGSFQSICKINKPLDRKEGYKIVPDAVNSGEFKASLFIKLPEGKSTHAAGLQNQVARLVNQYQYLSLNNNADYMLDITSVQKGSMSLSLVEKGDSVLWKGDIKEGDSLSAAAWQAMLKEIKLSMRIKYIRNMTDGGSLAEGVSVQIIPEKEQLNTNETIFQPLDYFTLKVVNNSPNDLYYTILDLLPGNKVQVIIPDEKSQPNEFMLKAKGEPLLIPKVQVEENSAAGKELLKIFLSKNPIELRNIFNRTKTRGNGNMQSIENVMNDMFKDEYSQNPTRGDMSNMKVDEIGILTVGFTIKK